MKTLFLFTSICAASLAASDMDPPPQPKPSVQKSCFHGIIASGYAWSMSPDIRGIDYTFWADSEQGYNSSLGNSPFFMLGFGYRLFDMLDIDFDYTFYETFHYQKNQTDSFANSRVRFFDLDHQSAIFNFSLYPYAFGIGSFELTPFIGIGIGVGTSDVNHFQTVYSASPYTSSSVTSIGNIRTTNAFAWQGMGGFRFNSRSSRMSLDLAYRYYNGGTFNTSSELRSYIGDSVDSTGPSWKGTLQTNQLYFSLNFAI